MSPIKLEILDILTHSISTLKRAANEHSNFEYELASLDLEEALRLLSKSKSIFTRRASKAA